MSADRIKITGIRGHGFHGVLAEERRDGQVFLVDVDVQLDLSTAGRSDDLTDTIDYGAVADAVHAQIEGEPCQLIEALADRIAGAVFAVATGTGVGIDEVEVTVHKPAAPIEVPFGDVSVTIRRGR